ncbi:hypothetical protein JCM8547_002441 [Rhodosporidiobolus lusitaniae]
MQHHALPTDELPTFHFTSSSSEPSLHRPPLPPSTGTTPPPPRLEQQEYSEKSSTLPPLFLSIDAGVTKIRACVLSEKLEVVWVEEVDLDVEAPEYGTRNGTYTMGDVVTVPSEMRILGVDLVLEKVMRDCPDPGVLGRVKAVSGAGQPHTLNYLLPSFPSLLTHLSTSAPHVRLSSVLTASAAFPLPNPASGGDSSTGKQVRGLETHFGALAQASSSSSTPALLAEGRKLLASRTGSKVSTRQAVAQLIKVREGDEKEREEGRLKAGVLERTERIVMESGLLQAVFLGRLAPLDASDACSTGLFNPVTEDWDDEVLKYVMGGSEEGGKRLRAMLGEVEGDGGRELGKISPYFVQRFGFSPDCLIAPFTGPSPSTFLSFPLYSFPSSLALSPQHPNEGGWRDALLSFSTSGGDTDELMVPAGRFVPSEERSVWRNPARGWWEGEDGEGEGEREEDGEERTARFVAAISSRDAGVGRALVRDLYANGEWSIFGHLSAIVPHGGTIGLDDKYFSFFFPHGEGSVAQGFLRFIAGARVQDFPDRKANPRLLLESQFLSLRLRLSHVYRSLTPSLSALDSPPLGPFDALGFPPLSPFVLPTRLILVGAPAQNPALSSLLSTVFNAPAFLPTEGGLRSFAKSAPGEDVVEEEEEYKMGMGGKKLKTTAAALGAAYKAAWAFKRSEEVRKGEEGDERIPFQKFLREGIERLADEKADREGPVFSSTSAKRRKEEEEGEKGEEQYSTSGTGTSGTRSTAPTFLSLPRAGSGGGGGGAGHGRSLSHSGVLSTSTSSHARGGAPSPSSSSLYASSSSASRPPAPSTAPTASSSGGRKPSLAPSFASTASSSFFGVSMGIVPPEGAATEELAPDPPGLSLVAMPDRDEWKYYSSMLPEFARLERYAVKGLI